MEEDEAQQNETSYVDLFGDFRSDSDCSEADDEQPSTEVGVLQPPPLPPAMETPFPSSPEVPMPPSSSTTVMKQPAAAETPTVKRRRLTGKQADPAAELFPTSVASDADDGAVMKRPAAASRNLCHGRLDCICIFNATNPGERSRHQKNLRCPWCDEDQLDAAFSTPQGMAKMSRSLQAFWEAKKDVFKAALQRLPDMHRKFFPLRALGLPASFHSQASMDAAMCTRIGRGNVTRVLKGLRAKDPELYESAKTVLPEDFHADEKVVQKKPAASKRAALRAVPRPLQWTTALQHRRPSMRHSSGNIEAYKARCADDKKHARRRFFPARAKTWTDPRYRDLDAPEHFELPTEEVLAHATVDETDLPDAAAGTNARKFQDWCKYGSWTMCKQCHRLESRALKPKYFRMEVAAKIEACKHCEAGSGYPTVQPSEQPVPLRELTPEIISALRPLDLDCGPVERAMQGYRVHTGMMKFAWSFQTVNEKINDLASKKDQKKAHAARKYLMKSDATIYGDVCRSHKKFLKKHKIGEDDNDEKSTLRLRQRPLRTIETEGIEACLWPHLYWTTALCETSTRRQDVRRVQREEAKTKKSKRSGDLDADSSSSDAEDSDGGKEFSGRQSLKASFMAKVLGPLTEYGTNYELMHFIYDLHMWSTLGAKKNNKYSVTLRIMVKGMSFSPLFWRQRHLGLLDLQRRLGFPSVFFTLAPYEWSWIAGWWTRWTRISVSDCIFPQARPCIWLTA